MDVFFGYGLKFGAGSWRSVAMNRNQDMVMAHIPSGHTLAYRQGTVQRASVAWTPDETYGDGREPSIAVNGTSAVEVHRGASNDNLYYGIGPLTDGRILWLGDGNYDTGLTPSVAINDANTVFEVHESEKDSGRLWYNLGLINGNKIDWNKNKDFADGTDPSVSINNAGQAIVAYTRNNIVYYRLATTDGKSVTFQAEHNVADSAGEPSVAVTDEGWFILCFNASGKLMQRAGMIDGTTVSWGGAVEFDKGRQPSVAAQNGLAVQVHASESNNDEFFSTSIITDRSRWMSDRVELGPLPLRELILPGSHDAGMYGAGVDTIPFFGKAQDKSIFQQLTYGIRWFDLRVTELFFPYDNLYIHHGEAIGPLLTEVLDDVKSFMSKGNPELVILKFSHFGSTVGGDFTADQYKEMVKQINDRLGEWLYRDPLPPGKRLADLTLDDYARRVLVVVDNDWAIDHPHAGFWVYRDAKAGNPVPGDLRVYDKYSDTNDYDKMKSQQIDHFFEYSGTCDDEAKTPCDLFLLSWTLTPDMGKGETVEGVAHTPDQHLADEVAKLPVTNPSGKTINIAYVDYAQYARPSDVAIAQRNFGGANG